MVEYKISAEQGVENNHEIRQGGYRFINPLLDCEVGRVKELEPFKHKVDALIRDKSKVRPNSVVSVYFREMNEGQWFGINENARFSPASLLKVSTMMAYFKLAESSPDVLSKKVKYAGISDYNYMENIRDSNFIKPGKTYTIDELIYSMIAYSDNNANGLLLGYIEPRLLDRTYSDLGIKLPDVKNPEDFMSVKSYASFFSILFNASYLNKAMSEKALEYLSKVDYKNGLTAGVAPGTVVSHKFGERSLGDNDEIKELHDCGIVYYPERPYLLCVMSKGDDFGYLSDTIRDISRLVFEEVRRQQSAMPQYP